MGRGYRLLLGVSHSDSPRKSPEVGLQKCLWKNFMWHCTMMLKI